MRTKEILTPNDLKNASNRARWTLLYFSGSFCDDPRTEEERVRFEGWHERKLQQAEAFLRGTDAR